MLITVAIPTFNRSNYLVEAIESVLSQTYQDFELLIVDNNSEDNIAELVTSFKDKRIRFHKNSKNIGIIESWNRCVKLAQGEYLLILGDDDKLYPRFIEESMEAHQSNDLGFSFTHCNKVDPDGNFIMRWGYDFPPSGYLSGFKYLELTIKYGCCLINSSTTVIKRAVFDRVGLFEGVYGSNTFDFNMWIKIANYYHVYFIDKVLVDYRIHQDQVSEIHWRRKERQTGKIGTYLEITEAISLLFNRPEYSSSRPNREFLSRRLKEIDGELALLLKEIIPEL